MILSHGHLHDCCNMESSPDAPPITHAILIDLGKRAGRTLIVSHTRRCPIGGWFAPAASGKSMGILLCCKNRRETDQPASINQQTYMRLHA
jgi:hypothetical protein